MSPIETVLFDVDGVLVDSLDAHLGICRDKSKEFGLKLDIPEPAALRKMLKRGVVISPMVNLFHAIGMPMALAERADRDYRRDFMAKYRPNPFQGVSEMLARLRAAGVGLGIVTSNTLVNVKASLNEMLSMFDPRLVFDRDDAESPTKVAALRRAAETLGVTPDRVLYVGDQYADFDAAKATRTRFLGVSYGWGFDAEESGIVIANTPQTVADYVLAGPSPFE